MFVEKNIGSSLCGNAIHHGQCCSQSSDYLPAYDPYPAPPRKIFSSGASSSTEKPWYHLIPLAALKRVAARFEYGAQKHGEVNYRKGFDDPAFIKDRKNHLIEHVFRYVQGDVSADHLGAILCNAAILAELEELSGIMAPPQKG
jgi:hypothetical protein